MGARMCSFKFEFSFGIPKFDSKYRRIHPNAADLYSAIF